MRIYLDNNATTQIHPAVLARMAEVSLNVYGNASSIHAEGQRARRVLEEAREQVAGMIGAAPREVVFTSGGTESNNAAIHGTVLSTRTPCHIVTTSIEHPSVLEPLRELASRGHEVAFVPPGADGRVSVDRLCAAIRDDTKLVCVMFANNETGVLQPVREIAQVCRSRGIPVHCDAVQAGGRVSLNADDLGVDMLALSAHKMHGPKGIGALFVRTGARLERHMSGGAQERRRRAGTENVPLAAGFGAAADLAGGAFDMSSVAALRDRFEARVRSGVTDVHVNGTVARIPNTSNLHFSGVDGESLVIALDLAGVAASTGSACSSGRTEPSHVLLEMGLSEQDAKSSLRFSLSRFNTGEEIERVADLLEEMVPMHRRNAAAKVS
ncbi:MAG TPA: cysteine desulfurase family protein [Thermoanaerobaculia bacterium]|nr:cysteine desulfurase family protein [Thermoanaerobaculia bacterium]